MDAIDLLSIRKPALYFGPRVAVDLLNVRYSISISSPGFAAKPSGTRTLISNQYNSSCCDSDALEKGSLKELFSKRMFRRQKSFIDN